MTTRKKRLAKDLDMLFGASGADVPIVGSPLSRSAERSEGKEGLRVIPLDQLQRGKYQPRREFDKTMLEELANSIASNGVMQPIIVRQLSDEKWEIVAGERRWRASQLAGVDSIPAIVRDVSDESAIAMALIENIQRQDLNVIEEGLALRRLQTEFKLSQQQVAERVGKPRSVIANILRLLTLESDVRHLLETAQLTAGHAKVLLALEGQQQVQLAQRVIGGRLSVRQTETLVKGVLAGQGADTSGQPVDANIDKLQRDLSAQLGAAVSIHHAKAGRGKLTIRYSSLDELDGILKRIR